MGWLTSLFLTAVFALIYFALADFRKTKPRVPDADWELDPVRTTREQRYREAQGHE